MLTFTYTEEEWKAMPQQSRVNLLELSDQRIAFERALNAVGREMKKHPDLRREWELLKKTMDREQGAKIFIKRPNGTVDLL